jgi:NAD-dependent deacetylase
MNDVSTEVLRNRINAAERIVFFTGAGMSAESGIPTFRDALTGLWERFDAATLASPQGYRADPALVWGWYEWRRMKVMQATPNAGHVAIANFAHRHPDKQIAVITQNVDDLHERAGSRTVTHLHGSILAPRCFACARPANAALIATIPQEPEGGRRVEPPRCEHCNGRLRPGVVWFGEALPEVAFKHATHIAKEAEVFIAIGTSGIVEPAASLVRMAKDAGAFVIVVDPNETGVGHYADAIVLATAAMGLSTLL